MNDGISDRAVLLGRRKSLVGILTQGASSGRANGPVIVILNTGIVHRIGHHRIYVTMARALARAGYTVLRFDFSGIGDSEPRCDGLPPLEGCLGDIKEALDWLEANCQASRIVLVGMCSGADHAVLYGHSDPRVVALVLMDPSVPATARYYVSYIGQRLTRLRSWLNVGTGRSRAVRIWAKQALYALRSGQAAQGPALRDQQIRIRAEQVYQASVDRGMKMLAVFTGDSTRQSYRDQIFDAFPNVTFGKQLQLEYFRDSDHTFMSADSRSKLIPLVLEWIKTARC